MKEMCDTSAFHWYLGISDDSTIECKEKYKSGISLNDTYEYEETHEPGQFGLKLVWIRGRLNRLF